MTTRPTELATSERKTYPLDDRAARQLDADRRAAFDRYIRAAAAYVKQKP